MNIAYRLREEAKMLSPETEQSTEYILLEAAEHIERIAQELLDASLAFRLIKAGYESVSRKAETYEKALTDISTVLDLVTRMLQEGRSIDVVMDTVQDRINEIQAEEDRVASLQQRPR